MLEQIAEATAGNCDPIAIIGMSCRLANGVNSPDELWQKLIDREVLSGPMPAERWTNDETRRARELVGDTDFPGYFLLDVDSFDSDYFVLPPREAATMDPQQRLALELTCEALQDAGIGPRGLARSRTGVYFGVGAFDFGARCLTALESIAPWSGIGSSHCGVANRISYALDLRGPSVAIDTACSASMVAIHTACQALRADEIDLAIVGGVNVIGAPGFTVALAAAGATSNSGSSRPFDQAADGYVRGEGGGVLVLQRVKNAQEQHNPIVATIMASVVGQEGRTNGIMAPSASAQSAMMREIYAKSGLDPTTISYVEAHGTGTPVGDPEEAEALSEIFGRSRPSGRPCWIGSIKANVGHLEAGSGVVSVIKAAQIVNRGCVPGQANFDAPTERIDWSTNGLAVTKSTVLLPQNATPYRAGVSGYGYGGTISHIVLQAPPRERVVATVDEPLERLHLPLSGRSPDHLQLWAERLGTRLGSVDDVTLAELAHTLTCRTDHQRYRCTVSASSVDDLAERLHSFATSAAPIVVDSEAFEGSDVRPVFVFSGHGSQWAGMAADLLKLPAFAAVVDDIDDIYAEELGTGCRELLLSDDFTTARATQAAIFSMQCGIAAVWHSFGVGPAAVIGQSIGEIAAAVEAGALSLADGARLACRKADLVRHADGKGAMLLVDGDEEIVTPFMRDRAVSIAIVTTRESLVIAGDQHDIATVREELNDAGIGTRRVASDVAFHSDHMDPLVEPLRAAAQFLAPRLPDIPLYTTALIEPRDSRLRDADYWCANLRNPVNFVAAVSAALDDSHRIFIEISPHPLVVHALRDIADSADQDVLVAHSARRERSALEEIQSNLATLFCGGVQVDWSAVYQNRRHVSLPSRPWIRRVMPRVIDLAAGGGNADTQLLTARPDCMVGSVRPVGNLLIAEAEVDYNTRPYPGVHAINGIEIAPASVLVCSFLQLQEHGPGHRLTDVQFRSAVTLTSERRRYSATRDGEYATLSSHSLLDKSAVIHATADLSRSAPSALATFIDTRPVRARCSVTRTLEELRELLLRRGVFADTYQWSIDSLYTSDDELIATLQISTHANWAAVLDACFTLPVLLFCDTDDMRMVIGVETLELDARPPADKFVIHARRRLGLSDGVDVTVLDSSDTVCGHLGNAQFVPTFMAADDANIANFSILNEQWCPRPLELRRPSQCAAIFVQGDQQLADALRSSEACIVEVLYVADADALLEATFPPDSVVLIATDNSGRVLDAQAVAVTLDRLGELDFQPRTWLVSRCVEGNRADTAPARGIGRVLAGEYPQLCNGSIGIPGEPTELDIAAVLARAVLPADNVDFIIEHGEVLEWALTPVSYTAVQSGVAEIYVLTDVSRLTIDIALGLASRGARRFVFLVTEPECAVDQAENELLEELAERAVDFAHIRIHPHVDSTELHGALAPYLDPDRNTAVIHTMGLLRGPVGGDISQGAAAVADVELLTALHEVFPPDSIELFAVLNGLEHIVGLRGCGATAGAATVAATLMDERSESGAPSRSISIAWAPDPRYLEESVRTNYIAELDLHEWLPIPVADLCLLLSAPLASQRGSVVAVTTSDRGHVTPLPTGASDGPIVDGMEIETAVRQCISRETTLSLEELAQYTSLHEIGADSVLLLSIRRALERTFKTKLPAKLLWDAPSIPAISDHIQSLAGADRG